MGMIWNASQVQHFVRGFKAKWTLHWHLLAQELREAVVDSYVLGIVTGLDRETVPVESIDNLRQVIHTASQDM